MQMRKFLIAALLISTPLGAQQIPQQAPVPQQTPTPDERAFARLPADLRALLGNLPPREALQKLDYARQNLLATGNPSPSADQLRAGVETALDPRGAAVRSVSAGVSS